LFNCNFDQALTQGHLKSILENLSNGYDLSSEELWRVFDQMFKWELSDIYISAFLVLLRSKWESVDEIYEASKKMREYALKIYPKTDKLLDTCWTWWDNLKTFNISTTCAFVLAWAWVSVAKHGNRSNSWASWSSDVLSELWVKLDLWSNLVEKSIEEIWIWFLFAPNYHKSMKHVAWVRKELAIRTIFNLLWPLTNPAWAKFQLIWVFSKKYLNVFAQVLKKHWSLWALIVCGQDWMDEITLTWKTDVCSLKDWKVIEYEIDPLDYWFKYCNSSDLLGWEPEENAQITKAILSGTIKWPKRDIVLLNSAAWLFVSWKADSIKNGIDLAKDVIDSWKALEKLRELVAFS